MRAGEEVPRDRRLHRRPRVRERCLQLSELRVRPVPLMGHLNSVRPPASARCETEPGVPVGSVARGLEPILRPVDRTRASQRSTRSRLYAPSQTWWQARAARLDPIGRRNRRSRVP
jgi:hypothetical protein